MVEQLTQIRIHCFGCGKFLTDFIPIPKKDETLELVCENCDSVACEFFRGKPQKTKRIKSNGDENTLC